MKKTLVIHPKDESTDFLRNMYQSLSYATIITGGLTQKEIIEEIKRNDRIIMCGHGSPYGLMSVGQFPKTTYGHVINENVVPYLVDKECVFIWCHANKFVEKYNLCGFYSGMFVSEVGEARYCGLKNVSQFDVTISNFAFSDIVGKYIHLPLDVIFTKVMCEYRELALINDVAGYNLDRLKFINQEVPYYEILKN